MARLRKIVVSVEFDCRGDFDNQINEQILRSIWLTNFGGARVPLVRVKLIDSDEYHKDQPNMFGSPLHDSDPLDSRLMADERLVHGRT